MWFGILLLLCFVPLAYGIAKCLWWLRYNGLDPDSDYLPDQKIFIRCVSIALGVTMLSCIPMLMQWKRELQVRSVLQPLPLVAEIRQYQPQVYDELRLEVLENGLEVEMVNAALDKATRKLRVNWLRSVPYASTDAVMRYIRYRYDEATLLAAQGDDSRCVMIGTPNDEDFSLADVRFMQKNAEYIHDAIDMVFDTMDSSHHPSYLEQRIAAQKYDEITQQLNKQFNDGINESFADKHGCEYQRAFYLRLLELSDEEMSKIMRWSLLHQINHAE